MTTKLLEKNRFASHVVREVAAEIEAQYGSRKRAGHMWMPYHNVDHALDVHNAAYATAQELVAAGKLDPLEVPNLRLRAIYHDKIVHLSSGENERASAAALAAKMRERPDLFEEWEIAEGEEDIEGTVTAVNNGKLTQAADPRKLTQAIIADADLSSLGHKSNPHQALLLFIESEAMAGRIELPQTAEKLFLLEPDHQNFLKFLRFQHNLYNHTYLLDINEKKLGPQKSRNKDFIRQVLQDAERGATFGSCLSKTIAYSRDINIGRGGIEQ